MLGTFTTWILLGPLAGALIAGFGWRLIGEKAAMWLTTGIMGWRRCSPGRCSSASGTRRSRSSCSAGSTRGAMTLDWGVRLDRLTAVMLVVVTTVSALVHLYSIGYMEDDDAKPRFFAYLSFFTFAMLMLVTADNLVQLFFGWEGVGVASYLLIGFW
jgi:NADH-quinone oxidoreductase subunit L